MPHDCDDGDVATLDQLGFAHTDTGYFARHSHRRSRHDGDGFTENEGDCDDSATTVHPNGVEGEVSDGRDNDQWHCRRHERAQVRMVSSIATSGH